jgi:hypothetical protein
LDNIQEPIVVVRQLGDGLVELGFAYHDMITNKVCIPDKQLTNIVNFDEACLSLDESIQNRGGQPEVILYDPRFPPVGKGTSKSSLTSTMITSSNAAGHPIPPHLQFQSKAKAKEAIIQYDPMDHMPRAQGQFGCAKVRLWPVTFGANEKRGMDRFEKFVMNSIVPLYPHEKNKTGMRVMLKVDSGPGRMNLNLLARL